MLGVGVEVGVDTDALDVDYTVTTLREQAETVARRTWRRPSAERVRVETRDDDTVAGEAVAVTERGALVVDTGGSRVRVRKGECVRLRRTHAPTDVFSGSWTHCS